jgi:hypothetical protein
VVRAKSLEIDIAWALKEAEVDLQHGSGISLLQLEASGRESR